jgi:hypothetical protein
VARQLDSDALRTYRDVVQAQLDRLETEVIPKLENGNELGRLPAFGTMDGADTARSNYTAFHEGAWNNIQALRGALIGIIDTLNASGDLSDESDELSATDMSTVNNNIDATQPLP